VIHAAALHASLLALALVAIGCGGGTVCDEAVSKLADECDLGGAVGVPGAPGIVECKERVSCNAECVIEASCEQIVSDKADNAYRRCLAECQKKKF
jgi:hypothetical protein